MCKGDFKTELTADLIARIIRRHFGWDRIPTDEEVDDLLLQVKDMIPEITKQCDMPEAVDKVKEMLAAVERSLRSK